MEKEKKEYQLQLFSGVEHGFALRCDLSKPYERKCLHSLSLICAIHLLPGYCKEQSLKGIAEYLDFYLSQGEDISKL